MSKAGIQSNRGDGYQTLVAFDWALTVLSDSNYQWLEVDSVTWQVDDVVIGKADGTTICCQCKKNQTAFKAWSMTDLADELNKAIETLTQDPSTIVHFYSRVPFGELAALQEFSVNFSDESSYRSSLGKSHTVTDKKLSDLITKIAPSLTTYEFLHKITFITSPNLERMKELLEERLRYLVSRPSAAFDTFWRHIDFFGMRVSNSSEQSSLSQSRLTKEDLKNLLTQSGSLLSAPVNIKDVLDSFKKTSSIGRAWCRDIGSYHIENPLVNELISAVEAKNRSILLTGRPGSGKTCVMLALQEKLEQIAQSRSNLLPLFIQSREFADLATVDERHAMGLSEQWVEKVARVADNFHVVVVIDSLDVLSIAREHSVLTYFLAQIDQLLLIPNVTVVTACRDFDRHYDRRISQREWTQEFNCQPLDWEQEIVPLLNSFCIDISVIDEITRTLIRNPRELALFVELAVKGGSFNVVTSQALAQRYIDIVILSEPSLGDMAKRAIEDIATEMLKLRSLAVPIQRFLASEDIRRILLSHNVLHETEDRKLTFGHQTLLDILVISGAIRQGVTLNDFIQSLPPVPFVRPTIRSFVKQLAGGERKEFRKQIRTVLSGEHAFHIRRLVAECLAELLPMDDDWPLLRDLRNTHRDVFQVIYSHASHIEWHFFWLKNLVPILKFTQDADGMGTHVYRVSQFINLDPTGVVDFWLDALRCDWLDKGILIGKISVSIIDVDIAHVHLMTPLILELLNFPLERYSFLGKALARCVAGGGLDDSVLWRYITADICDEDVLSYQLNEKLRCQSHEFGDREENFLLQRMTDSTILLELAVSELERWSKVRCSQYTKTKEYKYWDMFLSKTSYYDERSLTDYEHKERFRIFMDAIEIAIIHNAEQHSIWWQENCARVCFNPEGSLRYFGLLACINSPSSNLDIITQLLSDKLLLESTVSYEMGTLIQKAFVQLDPAVQDTIQTTIHSLYQKNMETPDHREYMLRKQSKLLICIPCHLRSPATISILDECNKLVWPFEHKVAIKRWSGIVRAPFSSEVFHDINDENVLCLLIHYNGYGRNSFSDELIGGEDDVAGQLSEASSQDPLRFLKILSMYWQQINEEFRNSIMNGLATYLNCQYGNHKSNRTWSTIDEPNIDILVDKILCELERHSIYWRHNHSASSVLQGCAHVVKNTNDAERLTFLAIPFFTLYEEDSISGDGVNFLDIGINMIRGHVVEALIALAIKLQENSIIWPSLLAPTLRRFATDEHPAIRAVVLRRLTYLQYLQPEFGWELFDLAMQNQSRELWKIAEPCLYYAYHQRFEKIYPWLEKIYREGSDEDLQVWGRISALCSLSQKINNNDFIKQIKSLNNKEAWQGAARVWTYPENFQRHRELCLAGLTVGMSEENQHALAVASKISRIFSEDTPLVVLPILTLQNYFSILQNSSESSGKDVFGIDISLNAISLLDPIYALDAAERYLSYVRSTRSSLHDYRDNLTQLLTRLFAQAEEQEESDSGVMLQRVVTLQDMMLSLGVNGISEWLKAAERA